MDTLEAIILGIVQGLTEFLPVSSSGHLVLTQELLGVNERGLTFEIMVHVGTLLSVLVYFRSKVFRLCKAPFTPSDKEGRRWILYLIIGTIPLFFVVPFKGDLEKVYQMPDITALLLIVTGGLLLLPKLLSGRADQDLKGKSAFFMGIGQAFAVLPGISRSGSTITAGLLCKVKPAVAAEFAFLLSIPAILGSLVLDLYQNWSDLDTSSFALYGLAAAAAFLSGLLAVYTVLATIRSGKFAYFAYYCFIAGITGFIYFRWVAPA